VQGIAKALLRFANDELRESNIERLFVTHGTINPTARNFWDRYKDMLGNIELY
jgi:hypothetical protein